MAKKTHKELIEKMGYSSIRNASIEAGLSQSTLTRHVTKNEVEPGEVIALARAKNLNPIAQLITFGYLKRSDVNNLVKKPKS